MSSYFNTSKKILDNCQQQEPEFDQYFGANNINKNKRSLIKSKNNSVINGGQANSLSLSEAVQKIAAEQKNSSKNIEFYSTSVARNKQIVESIIANESELGQLPLDAAVREIASVLDKNGLAANNSTAVAKQNQQSSQISVGSAAQEINSESFLGLSNLAYQELTDTSQQITSWIFDNSFMNNQNITHKISNENRAIVAQENIQLLASQFNLDLPNQVLAQSRSDDFDLNKFVIKKLIHKFFAEQNQTIVDTPQEQIEEQLNLIVERAVQDLSLRNVIRLIALGETQDLALPSSRDVVESRDGDNSEVIDSTLIDNPQAPIRINAGGSGYIDVQGNVWTADRYFVDGNAGLYRGISISNTEDDFLYQSERWFDNLAYDIPILNGNYSVNLHFSEVFFDSAESRIFDVSIEDTLVIDDLDLYQSRSNAAFDGQNSAFIVSVPQVEVTDGILDLDAIASVNNAKISAIEIVPLNGAQVLIEQTNGNTSVTEGFSSDTYSLVLNSRPSANVTVDLRVDNLLGVSTRRITFTPDNFDIPQEIEVSALDNNALTGTRRVLINSRVSSEDPNFNNLRVPNLAVSILDDESIEINFTQRVINDIQRPTTAAWGPDNRLYVGTVEGLIYIYEFDDDYNVLDRQIVETVSNQEEATSILGIAFNPFDTSDSPTIYVSRSNIRVELNPNPPRTPLPNPTAFSNRVSTLGGTNFDELNDIVTGLPVSGFDHGVNGLQFDNNGDLLIAVGGNTDNGFVDNTLRTFRTTVPESPLSGAILKAEISRPDFNGNVTYEFVPGVDLPPGADPNDQNNGSLVRVAPGSDVSVFAAGLRNAYDLVFTTQGRLFATDNGPGIENAVDELNLIEQGGFLGHANPARALEDPRQAVSIFDPNVPSNDSFTAPIATFPASTNGLDEFRSNVFGGQLRGSLFAANLFNGNVLNFELSEDGEEVVDTQSFELGRSLDIVNAPGGALVGVNFLDNLLSISIPDDNSVGTQTIAFDISVSRAAATGGNEFVIAGANFGDLYDTTVTIGDQTAYLTSVSDQRIVGILPSFYRTEDEILDVVVESNGNTSTIDDAFRPLF